MNLSMTSTQGMSNTFFVHFTEADRKISGIWELVEHLIKRANNFENATIHHIKQYKYADT